MCVILDDFFGPFVRRLLLWSSANVFEARSSSVGT